MQVNVLNAMYYNFPNKETGEVIEGAKVAFLSEVEHTKGKFTGQRVSEASLSIDQFRLIEGQLPSLCEVDLTIVPGAKGKSTVKVISIKPVKAK